MKYRKREVLSNAWTPGQDWSKIVEAYAFWIGLNAPMFVIGWLAFLTRNFKT
ncbi:MAG: hypothetical protein H8M99_03660 [Gloeobacteraceae cyanobacterium ES-bin-144]|nr:hypothetical protein [Verrucomicrobiales bacterium]